MYEELYAPLPDVNAYLKRIGLSGESPAPTVAWLDRLVHAQLTHIPFDDMDCWGRGDTPSLAIQDVYEKIVVRRRGGYCFELNSLFLALLRALGFEAYMVIVRITAGRPFVTPPSHCAIICTIDGEKYFCDVGYGGPVPDGCVRYDDAVHHGYRIGSRDNFRTLELIKEDGSAETIMLYHDVAVPPVDMLPLNFHVSQRPGSLFRSTLSVNLRLPDGGVWISGKKLSLHSSTERFDRELRDLDDLRDVLERYFGIPADEAPMHDLDVQI